MFNFVIVFDMVGPKEKVQKDKQLSTKHTHKTKDRVTRTPLKTGGELMYSGRVHILCSLETCFMAVMLYSMIYRYIRIFIAAQLLFQD